MTQNTKPQRYRVAANDIYWKLLLYGFNGAGKTVFAAGANDHPRMKNAMFLNIEGGLLSVAYRGDVNAIDIRSTKELEQALWDMAAKTNDFAEVRTLVIDSGSEVQTMNLEEITLAASRSNKSHGRDEVWQDDYQLSTVTLKRLFRMARDLPYHVIITALPKVIYPRTSGSRGQAAQVVQPTEISPWMTTKLAEALMGYMDMVWYMWVDERGRHLLTRSQGVYRAKTRGMKFAQRLGAVVSDPVLPSLFDLFLEAETGAKPQTSGRVQTNSTATPTTPELPVDVSEAATEDATEAVAASA